MGRIPRETGMKSPSMTVCFHLRSSRMCAYHVKRFFVNVVCMCVSLLMAVSMNMS